MYWAHDSPDKIQRANLDGSNIEDLITSDTGLRGPRSITLDLTEEKIYWADRSTRKIQCANLDGSNIHDLVTTGLRHPDSIALDLSGE